MISILIADDHRLFRETMAYMLSVEPDFNVVAQCDNSTAAIEAIRGLQPAVVLMDINIEPVSGMEATIEISKFSSAQIIGLSMHARSSIAKKMMQSGAAGYVTKNSSREEIFSAIRTVATGGRYLCSEIKNIMSDELLNTDGRATTGNLLTDRETQVAGCIGKGLSSKEISATLNIALKTVEVHRYNILKKLNVRNASSLVDLLHQKGVAGFAK